jgi:hypothetical protein
MKAISIATFASPAERAAVEAAGRHIERVLSEATGQAWRVERQDLESLEAVTGGAPLVTSFSLEVDVDEPWPATEARLRARYAGLGESGEPVFICTVLRHVRDPDPAESLRRRVRIRRLNLLAADISRESGAFVIDIDRVLADIGAEGLATDYRLAGAAAGDQAAKCIAMAIIVNGLDAFADFEALDRARDLMAQYQPSRALPADLRPRQLVAMGRGPRRQVAAVEQVAPDAKRALLLQQILKREIGLGVALRMVAKSVQRQGLRRSAQMLAVALRRLASKRLAS